MSKPWSIPLMWEGQSCVIFASGKSLSVEDVEAVRFAATYRVIAVNNSWERAPWADLIYAADKDWWHTEGAKIKNFSGLKVTCEENGFDDVLHLKAGATEGFSDDPSVLNTGGNSGYQALGIAVHAGCRRILLCGYDMRPGHWHPEHKTPLRVTRPEQYATWIVRYRSLIKPLASLGVEVINCTPNSALDAFPHGVLADELLQRRKVA